MENNTSMKLLAILLFGSLFSFNFSKCQDVPSEEEEIISEEPGTVGSGKVNSGETEEVLPSEEPAAEVGEAEAATESPTVTPAKTRKGKASTSRAPKKVSTASRKPSKKVTTGKTRKQVTPKKSDVAMLGEFQTDGNIDSFTEKADATVKFIESKDMLNSQDRMDLYAVLVKFKFILGREGFTTDEHYNEALKVFEAASENPKLFNTVQLKRINDWKDSIKKEIDNPSLRKTSKGPAQRKAPSKSSARKSSVKKQATTATKKAVRREH